MFVWLDVCCFGIFRVVFGSFLLVWGGCDLCLTFGVSGLLWICDLIFLGGMCDGWFDGMF